MKKNVESVAASVTDAMGNILLLLALIAGVVNHSDGLKCYACGDTNTFLGENYTIPISCRDFDDSTPEQLQKFIIDCPTEYAGCITQKQGDQVTRTCDTYAIDDCQVANGVTYCYCNYELCNGKTIAQVEQRERPKDLTDDEDYGEMSGFGEPEETLTTNDGDLKTSATATGDYPQVLTTNTDDDFELPTSVKEFTKTTKITTTTTVTTDEPVETVIRNRTSARSTCSSKTIPIYIIFIAIIIKLLL